MRNTAYLTQQYCKSYFSFWCEDCYEDHYEDDNLRVQLG